MEWCQNIITHPRSTLVKEKRLRMSQRKQDSSNHHSLHDPVTQGQWHTQNTAGEKTEQCCSLRAPPTQYKFGSDWPGGDDFSCFSFILLLPVSVLIFTHFSPNYVNYCYFSKQYIYITRRREKRKQVLVNHCNLCICKWLLVKETVYGGDFPTFFFFLTTRIWKFFVFYYRNFFLFSPRVWHSLIYTLRGKEPTFSYSRQQFYHTKLFIINSFPVWFCNHLILVTGHTHL